MGVLILHIERYRCFAYINGKDQELAIGARNPRYSREVSRARSRGIYWRVLFIKGTNVARGFYRIYSRINGNVSLRLTQGADLAIVFGQDESGIGTILELITTQTNLAQARQERVEALTTWRYDRPALGAALGRLGPSDL